MLNFLDHSRHQKEQRPSLHFKPEMVYGHTRQSSPHMIGEHTVYYQSESESNKLPQLSKVTNVKSPPSVKEEFSISTQLSPQLKKHQPKLSQGFDGFNLTKGEFTGFLDRHKHYKSIGELHKAEDSKTQKISSLMAKWNKSTHLQVQMDRSDSASKKYPQNIPRLTLKSDWKRSSMVSSLPGASITFTRSSSLSALSSTFDKTKIRIRREEFHAKAQKQIDLRRNTHNGLFGLPRDGPNHELYFAMKPKMLPIMTGNEMDEMNRDINVFQKKMVFKFK